MFSSRLYSACHCITIPNAIVRRLQKILSSKTWHGIDSDNTKCRATCYSEMYGRNVFEPSEVVLFGTGPERDIPPLLPMKQTHQTSTLSTTPLPVTVGQEISLKILVLNQNCIWRGSNSISWGKGRLAITRIIVVEEQLPQHEPNPKHCWYCCIFFIIIVIIIIIIIVIILIFFFSLAIRMSLLAWLLHICWMKHNFSLVKANYVGENEGVMRFAG